MKLFTEEQRTKLLANGTRRGADHKPVVKWFNAGGSGTWLLSELDPECPDECAFGLADLGFGTPELGSIGLLELTEYRGPFGLGIERDIHFAAHYTISIYAKAARAAGHIVESGPELEAAARILAEVMDADERRDDATGQSGESPLDTPAEEQAWDEAMHQAASLARAQGNAPGAVEETIRQAHRSILDWRSLLRRYMTDAARRDYSWSVPNRRFIDSGLYLPSMHSQGIDAIAIIIDTSASLPGETLALFWAEIREIAAELQPESIYVLQVDAVLQDAAEYPAGDLPDCIAIKGRGGTDFRPGFEWLHEHGVHPNCCLYLTDMECDSYPEAAPGYPVVWVNWGAAGGPNREPWGERIDIGPA